MKKLLIIIAIILILTITGCSPQEHQVNIDVSPKDSGEVVGEGTYEAGEEVELAAIPKEGYDFSSWEMDGKELSRSKAFKIAVDGDKNIKANFKKLKEDIYATVKIKEGRKIVLGPFTEKEKINLSAKEEVLHEFIRWEVDGQTVSKEKEFEYILGDKDVYIEAVYKNVEKELDEKIELLKQNVSEEEWKKAEKNLEDIIAMYKGDTSKSIDEILDEIYISWNIRTLLNESDEILKALKNNNIITKEKMIEIINKVTVGNPEKLNDEILGKSNEEIYKWFKEYYGYKMELSEVMKQNLKRFVVLEKEAYELIKEKMENVDNIRVDKNQVGIHTLKYYTRNDSTLKTFSNYELERLEVKNNRIIFDFFYEGPPTKVILDEEGKAIGVESFDKNSGRRIEVSYEKTDNDYYTFHTSRTSRIDRNEDE
ncbi:MAG TPA: hypothetical protein DHM42_03420 [Clostridiales bacterium]|nr:hypothetical protein [Clostridiales bacterium]